MLCQFTEETINNTLSKKGIERKNFFFFFTSKLGKHLKTMVKKIMMKFVIGLLLKITISDFRLQLRVILSLKKHSIQ